MMKLNIQIWKSLPYEAHNIYLHCSAFSDWFEDDAGGPNGSSKDSLIHVRIQQRNGRKTLTTVQGLKDEYDKKKILSFWKKVSVVYHYC